MFAAGFIAALGGMFCLAATQPKQAALMFNQAPTGAWRRLAMGFGTALLVLSAWVGVDVYGPGVGLVTFCAWACVAGWIVALALTWKRRQ